MMALVKGDKYIFELNFDNNLFTITQVRGQNSNGKATKKFSNLKGKKMVPICGVHFLGTKATLECL